MMFKTIQELFRGDEVKHEFFFPLTGETIKDFVEVSDIEFIQEDGIFLIAFEYEGYLFEESFKTNTAFITN